MDNCIGALLMTAILLTRPEPDASRLAKRLRSDLPDVDVEISPMQRIEFTGDLPATTPETRLIFTSRNGLRAWHAKGGPPLPCYCVGNDTWAMARDLGHAARAAAGRADDLVQLVQAESPDTPMIHVHGAHQAGDVAGALRRAGLQISDAVLYDQRPAALTPKARRLLDGPEPVIVPLYSPRSAKLFRAAQIGKAPLFIGAISPSLENEIQSIPAIMRLIADQPDSSGMLTCINGLLAAARQLEAGRAGQ